MLNLPNFTGMNINGHYDDLLFVPEPEPPAVMQWANKGVFNLDALCDYFEGKEVKEW